jgi:SAM-dependent methyltransferase
MTGTSMAFIKSWRSFKPSRKYLPYATRLYIFRIRPNMISLLYQYFMKMTSYRRMRRIAGKMYWKSRSILFSPFVIPDFIRFKAKGGLKRFHMSLSSLQPEIWDKTTTTGFDRHYVYHTSWAARVVAEIKPKKHIDISSSLFFCGIVSAFIPVEFYDYRPADLGLSGLKSVKGDLMRLPFPDNSVESISCLHTIEHVGLGRYGDPIDPNGDIKAIDELKRVTAKKGSLLFVVPIGETACIKFNAHRIYTYDQVTSLFSGFSLKEFSFIPEYAERGGLIRNASSALTNGESYACGCFWFIKNN